MTNSAALLADLKAQLRLLQQDLRAQIEDETSGTDDVDGTGLGPTLRTKYERAFEKKKTGLTWTAWRDNEIDQIAVAWLVATTFVRFCEDNHLLDGARDAHGKLVPTVWLAGPGGRTALAIEYQGEFFRGTTRNRRDWILQALTTLTAQPAGTGLVDSAYVTGSLISAEAADRLVDFWRRSKPDGEPVHDFTDDRFDTRFLGDLYQDLSEHARKTYALLQTPVFVEEFILDLTLEPAVKEHGLKDFKVIDPTCGSGHFLLGAFARLERHWADQDPTLDARARMLTAMTAIHGVDLNPFAVAIARFRLTVAGMLAAGIRSLVEAPAMPFTLAVGDSLLAEQGGTHEEQQLFHEGRLFDDGTLDLGLDDTLEYAVRSVSDDVVAVQDSAPGVTAVFGLGRLDKPDYRDVLKPGTYNAVVGNPPYIAVSDKILKKQYKDAWTSTYGKWVLSVPFAELFFRLAIRGDRAKPAGFVGQITSNSFMTREFGQKLVEEFFTGHHAKDGRPADLTHVIDTSGAFIPGHGTPTIILIGRTRDALGSVPVRAVLGKRGEPGQPDDPAKGRVWNEIVEHLHEPGFDGAFVSVADLDRSVLRKHPWSLSGGGASGVKAALESVAVTTLHAVADSIGIIAFTLEDDVYIRPSRAMARARVQHVRELGIGDKMRDWSDEGEDLVLFPYEGHYRSFPLDAVDDAFHHAMWPYRTNLSNNLMFGGRTKVQDGLSWTAFGRLTTNKLTTPLSIAFSSVQTHNHFVLDRNAKIFKQSAPVIKLAIGATEDEHFGLLGVLNSSTACFWLKQVSHGKTGASDNSSGGGNRWAAEEWDRFYDFTATKLQAFPVPPSYPPERARALDLLATNLAEMGPGAVVHRWTAKQDGDLRGVLREAATAWDRLRSQMIFEQEEIDWEVYRFYGLVDEDLTWPGQDGRVLDLGQRAFEIVLARQVAASEDTTAWFDRHGSTPITDLPDTWPPSYRELVQRRLDLIADDPTINLLERPEYKRRWSTPGWDALQRDALTEAIRDYLEDPELWEDGLGPTTRSVSQLADALRGDPVVRSLVDALAGDDADLTTVLAQGVEAEAVPYLAALRLKESGLAKFAEWQRVWDLQRREDAGGSVEIPVPPRYVSADFRKGSYAKARGGLDVPKERFVLYPGVARSGDRTPVLGWAGWDYATKARALAREITEQQAEGAEADILVPLLAGLLELLPWLYQWHAEPDETFGMSPAEAIDGFVRGQLDVLGVSRQEAAAWRPQTTRRGRAGAR